MLNCKHMLSGERRHLCFSARLRLKVKRIDRGVVEMTGKGHRSGGRLGKRYTPPPHPPISPHSSSQLLLLLHVLRIQHVNNALTDLYGDAYTLVHTRTRDWACPPRSLVKRSCTYIRREWCKLFNPPQHFCFLYIMFNVHTVPNEIYISIILTLATNAIFQPMLWLFLTIFH